MLLRVALTLVLWLTLAGAAQAAIIDVSRTDDRVGGTCLPNDCTLREALALASPGDTLQLRGTPSAAQVYAVTQGAHLIVDKSLTIAGGGPTATGIDGSANVDTFARVNRIMRVQAGAVVTLRDLSFSGGRDGNDENFVGCGPCSTITANGGGAIFNLGQLTVERAIFEANENSPTGGAIGNRGTLALSDVEFHGNSAAFGGALFSRDGVVTGTGVTFHANRGTTRGAVYVRGGTMELTNATVAANGQSNTVGGGVFNGGGDLTLRHVTIADNVRGGLMREAGVTRVVNSILASGCAPAGQFDAVVAVSQDQGHNLAEDDTCGLTAATSVVGQAARLAPVNANGGATPTVALLSGSPAMDAIPVQDCVPTDQRGTARFGGQCDIGAFEAERLGAPTATTGAATDIGSGEAKLVGTADLEGEPGTLSFEWGTAPDQLVNRTLGVALRGGLDETRNELVSGLPPATRIYYRAVAENASGIDRALPESFVTQAAPPELYGLEIVEVTDTSARVQFTADPNGSAASYRVLLNGGEAGSGAVGGGEDPVDVAHALAGLTPGARFDVQVIVTSAAGEVSDARVFRTAVRATGVVGQPTTLVLTGEGDLCPSPAQIDWGDDTTTQSDVTCNGLDYRLEATHTYARADRYRIEVDFGDFDATAFAVITAPAEPTATPTATPTTEPTPSPTAQVAQPTPTPTPTPVPQPDPGREIVAAPAGGTVLVKLPGTRAFVALKAGQELPYGTEIDTRKGRVTLTSIPKAGAPPETAVFYDGLFRVSYVRGITNLTLTEPLAACPRKGRASAAAKKAKSRRLWGKGKGAFRTSGRYSAATVRGTTWLVQDTCAGTLTRVAQGAVTVRHGKKTVVVRAGKRYLAKPRR